jgi:3' terminal RNA ribose 2'-O-methyltransferase Hen1
LEKHPAKERIVSRYLLRYRNLVEEALEQLIDDQPDEIQDEGAEESDKEEPIRLQEERVQSTIAILKTLNPPPLRIGDLGCGSGALIKLLVSERAFEEIIGMDVSSRSLQIAEKKLRITKRQVWQKPKVSLLHGSLVYMDARLKELDTILLLEVIEHLEPAKIPILEHNVFEYQSPRYIFVSTPNVEYNQLFPSFQERKYRHADHRFEWTRKEFKQWAERLGEKYSYTIDYYNIGTPDEKLGAPTQMAVFRMKSI